MAAPALVEEKRMGSRVRRLKYTVSGANDGNVEFDAARALLGLTGQLTGTYNSGSITFNASNDKSTWVALPTAVAWTALGLKSVAVADLGFLYYRLVFASMHASNDLVVWLVLKEAP